MQSLSISDDLSFPRNTRSYAVHDQPANEIRYESWQSRLVTITCNFTFVFCSQPTFLDLYDELKA